MSILETFYILFKSDASQVKKGSDEAKKSTDTLNESLKNTNSNATQVGESFTNMGRSLLGVIAALGAVGTIVGTVKESFAYTLQLQQSSQALNVNAADLDAWGNAVTRNGGTVSGFENSIKSLGVSLNITNQSALGMLPRLADIFQKVGTERSMRFGEKIGLDQATIMLLQKGRREVEGIIERQRELGVVTRQDTEIALKFNQQWEDLTTVLRSNGTALNETLLPALGKILDFITRLAIDLRQHKDLIVGAFIGIGTAVAFFVAPIIEANAAVVLLVGAITLLISTFALLYEDFEKFSKGDKSLIGVLMKKFGTPQEQKTLEESSERLRRIANGTWKEEDEKKFSGKSSFNPRKLLSSYIESGKHLLGIAEKSQISSQTSNSIFNNGFSNKSASIQTGPITIFTQSSDPQEVGGALARNLSHQLRLAQGSVDDGILS